MRLEAVPDLPLAEGLLGRHLVAEQLHLALSHQHLRHPQVELVKVPVLLEGRV